jgi:hypothetical protein
MARQDSIGYTDLTPIIIRAMNGKAGFNTIAWMERQATLTLSL